MSEPAFDHSPRLAVWPMTALALGFGGVLIATTWHVCEPADAVSPDHAAMHFHLGKYQRLSDQPAKAVESLKRALANQPQSFGTLAELGNAFLRRGHTEEAVRHFEAALAIQPDSAEAHCNLGNILMGQGRTAEACQHYRRALETEPREISALNNLAWIMATSADPRLRDGQKAVEVAERAADITARRQPVILMTLGAAYAASGRFEEAVSTAEHALLIAGPTGNEGLLRTLRAQLATYRQRKVWNE